MIEKTKKKRKKKRFSAERREGGNIKKSFFFLLSLSLSSLVQSLMVPTVVIEPILLRIFSTGSNQLTPAGHEQILNFLRGKGTTTGHIERVLLNEEFTSDGYKRQIVFKMHPDTGCWQKLVRRIKLTQDITLPRYYMPEHTPVGWDADGNILSTTDRIDDPQPPFR